MSESTPQQELSPIERKVQALFDKAAALRKSNDPSAEHEADTALAMAQKMIAKHQIDLQLLQQKTAEAKKPEEIVDIRFNLHEGPYLKHRANLASRIAMSMGLRTRIATSGSYVRFIGFESDVRLAWKIAECVQPQMTYMADRRVKAGAHREVWDWTTRSGHMSAKTWKNNYFKGFIDRVAGRIHESRTEAAKEIVMAAGIEQEDGTVVGRITGELVLVDRAKTVETRYRELYPEFKINPETGRKIKDSYWKAPKATKSSLAAQRAGRIDGSNAKLEGHEALTS